MHPSWQESGYSIRETSSRHTTCESKYGRTPKAKKRLSPGIDPSSCSLCFTFNAAILWALFPSISNLVQKLDPVPAVWMGVERRRFRSELAQYFDALPCATPLCPSYRLSQPPTRRFRRNLLPRACRRRGKFSSALSSAAGTPALLQRPSDRAIGRAIGLSVCELIAARVQLAGNCALVCLPGKVLVE